MPLQMKEKKGGKKTKMSRKSSRRRRNRKYTDADVAMYSMDTIGLAVGVLTTFDIRIGGIKYGDGESEPLYDVEFVPVSDKGADFLVSLNTLAEKRVGEKEDAKK